jgi:hypothetical protein
MMVVWLLVKFDMLTPWASVKKAVFAAVARG